MKKHILVKHLVVWCKWKKANVTFDLEEPHQEKFKKRFAIDYRAIIKHFGSANPYKKDDA
jgi:hypothetical protein